MVNYTNFFYHNTRLLLLAICLIVVSGLSSFFILPRMEDPQLVSRGAFVNTIFPGADPARVESLVSEKIEDALSEIYEIKEIRSTSREGISAVAIELRDDVLEADPVWSKIRDRINDIEGDLPTGALKPDFDEMDFKAYALLVALRWNQDSPVNYAVLYRWAKQLEDRLQALAGTEKAELAGEPAEEILVSLDQEQLAALNFTVADVASQISRSDAKIAAGQIRGESQDLLMEVAGELDSIQRIENIPIRYQDDGAFVRLSNIARVEKTIADPPDSLAVIAGQRAIAVGAFVRPTQRIDVWSADVEQALDDFEAQLPNGITLDRMFLQNDYVADRLSTLLFNLLMGGIAVFLVILFLMGWRSALVVSLALPLTSMMVLFVMRILNVPIHQMSVTGLIIALGLLIDNAIVIVDETSSRLRSGMSGARAVSESVRHLLLPLFGSTLTTALAFAPIALMPGPAGEFVGAIAITVITAIFSSLFLAMTIIPSIAARISPFQNEPGSPLHEIVAEPSWWKVGFSNARLTSFYKRTLDLIYRFPFLGIGLGIVAPILGFVAATQLPEQFFPPADRDQIHIELELGPQSSLNGTLATTEQIRRTLMEEAEIQRVDWFIGESAPAFYYNLIPRRAAVSQYAQALVKLNSFENQAELIHRLQTKLDREFSHARVLVRQLEQGPPFDAPVEVRLFGPDLDRLQQLGAEVRSILVQTPGVIHTRSELDEVLPKIAFDIKEERARAAGLSLTDIAWQLNASTEGAIGGSVVEATEELPVRVRLDNVNRRNLTEVASIDIVGSNQNSVRDQDRYAGVPISALADVSLKSEFGSITHLAGRRMNEIQVYIPAGVLPSKVLASFQERLAASGFKLPPGYQLTYGGESAKRDEAVSNLMASVGILVVLMVATLVMSFGSFRLAAIVGAVGALSIGLGMGALWIFGYPFGFTAIIGSMGLMGVSINDTIVVLAAIRENTAAAAGDLAAIRDVVTKSTRHVISTSLTTMAGFTPLILGGGGFWPPLAVAIAGGVLGATVLAIYFSPSAYLILMCRGKATRAFCPQPVTV